MDTIFHPWIFSWAGKDCLHGYGYGFDNVQPDPNPTHCHPYKELIYLLQKFISPRSKVLLCMLLWEGLVGVNHRVIPTSTHKESNQRTPHAPTSLHNGSPYVHASGITNLNTSISTNPQSPTSMTLISPSLYRKTSARNQTYHIQCSTSFM